MSSSPQSLRDVFLQQHWESYPPRPAGLHWQWGRLIAVNDQHVTLWRPEKTCTIKVSRWHAATDAQSPAWESVVREQDWLAINELTGELIMLAPALAEPLRNRIPEWSVLKNWAKFLSLTRDFFSKLNFIEVQTPSLVPSPGTEPWMNPFRVEVLSSTRQPIQRYLPFSPEYHLKKFVCLGGERIFEIARCYRNGDCGPLHQPEFWMLEWYQAFSNLDELQVVLCEWLQYLGRHLEHPITKVETMELAQLFKKHLNVELTPAADEEDLRRELSRLGEGFSEDDVWDDLFSRLMLRLEPMLGPSEPVIVTGFPARLAQLARLRNDGWADRCELYWNGVELANGFHELTNPDEQERRCHADLNARLAMRRPSVSLDDEFIQALRSGMPPTSGIAVGLERVFAQFMSLSSLNDIRPFPII